jgi:hypothetical protein
MTLRPIVALTLTLVGAAACHRSADAPDSGVRGVVLVGPQCPVEVQGSPCPDTPFEGTVRATTTSGAVAGEADTDDSGRFELDLEPGTYTLAAVVDGGGPPTAVPQTVDVTEGSFAQVTLEVDSGIR